MLAGLSKGGMALAGFLDGCEGEGDDRLLVFSWKFELLLRACLNLARTRFQEFTCTVFCYDLQSCDGGYCGFLCLN